jgi:lycopene beta-cyclase
MCYYFNHRSFIRVHSVFTRLLARRITEREIEKYIQNSVFKFQIIEKEGSIPMTCYPFLEKTTKRVLNMEPLADKAITGYTFKNSNKVSAQFAFLQKAEFAKFHKKTKFWFYDLLLLDI